MNDEQLVERATSLRGSLRVPGDKSTSHRALILSALAEGASTITGLSPGEDVRATREIVTAMGARCADEEGRLVVTGPGEGLHASDAPLECGNSGTTMRLLCGVVSTVAGVHELVGDESLSRRPMDRVATPLALMGSVVSGHGSTVTPPLRVTARSPLRAIDYDVPVVSAQVKSAILLAGLGAEGATTVRERVRTRSTTETMLAAAGVSLVSEEVDEGRRLTLQPSRPLRHDWFVPGDPSQAAYFAVLGAIHPDASLEVLSVDAAPERVGYVGVLTRMGARVRLVEHGQFCALTSLSSSLVATEVRGDEIPSVDEVPILTVAACAATGVTAFRGVGELRHKESDRFAASMQLASALGAATWSEGDDFFVRGLGSAEAFRDFTFDAELDHRLVMSSAVAGAAGRGCRVEGAATVATSYPSFFRDLWLLGEH